MARYRMTPARRAALRKAQAASARKRRGSRPQNRKQAAKSRRRKIIKHVATAALIGAAVGGGVAYHKSERAEVNRGVRTSIRKQPLRGSANRHARMAHGRKVKPLVRHNVRRRRVKRKAGR